MEKVKFHVFNACEHTPVSVMKSERGPFSVLFYLYPEPMYVRESCSWSPIANPLDHFGGVLLCGYVTKESDQTMSSNQSHTELLTHIAPFHSTFLPRVVGTTVSIITDLFGIIVFSSIFSGLQRWVTSIDD